MAANDNTSTFDIVEDSLANALWFFRHGRFLASLYALENAMSRCSDERRGRIRTLAESLGNTPIVQLALV
jgi:hypothetical protein